MRDTKIKSYIGFAVRMRKVCYGVDGIRTDKHKQYVIIYDDSLAANSVSRLSSYAESRGVPLYKVGFSLAELLKRDNVKAIAIGDLSLGNAILGEFKEGRNE